MKLIYKIFILSGLIIFGSLFVSTNSSSVFAENITIFGKPLYCDPSLPPSGGGCGFPAFLLLINYAIDFARVIVIPVGVLMMIYAGFVIITAGGSSQKVSRGKAIITTALIGIAIALAGGIIISIIYELFTGQKIP